MLLEVWTVVLAVPVRVPMTGVRSRVLGTGLLSHAPSMLGGRARYSQVPCHSSVVTQGLAIIPLRCRHRGPAASAAGGKEASSGIVPGPSIRPAQVPVPALRARAGPGRDSQGRDGNDPRAPCPRFTSSRPTSRVPGMTTNVQSYFGCSGALFKCKWPLALPVGRAPVDRLAAHRRQSPPANIDESQSLWRAPAGVLVRGDCVRRGARYRMRSALDASFSSIKLLAARRLAPLPRGICINLHITYAHTYKYTNQRYIHAHNPRT
jgi:hypothetical protein